jgi:hypothetical protein
MTFDLIVGNVVTNCDGSNETVQSQTTGSISLTDTWSIDADLGITFEELLDLGVVGQWSESRQTTFSQAITIMVDPGLQVRFSGSLILNVISPPSSRVCLSPKSSISGPVAPYRSTAGKATLPVARASMLTAYARDDFPLISNQPVTVQSYGAMIVPCGQPFAANVSSPITCSGATGVPAPVLAVFAGVFLSLLTLWV